MKSAMQVCNYRYCCCYYFAKLTCTYVEYRTVSHQWGIKPRSLAVWTVLTT
jgi:hypothetical protein